MNIQLIASDLDGTLLRNDKSISEVNQKALKMASEKGILFVPATGRAFHSIPKEILALPGTEYVITSNGAAIYLVSRQKRIYQCLLRPESVEALLSLETMEDRTAIEVFVDGVPYSGKAYVDNPKKYGATDFGEVYVKNTRHPVDDIRRFAYEHRDRLDSFDFICNDQPAREQLRQSILQQVPGVYVTSSYGHLLEIGHKEAGKGKTLTRLLEILGISPSEAMAFGDADNDLPMLRAVKYGIAMGNAAEGCKRAAYAVTKSNEEDGVGLCIMKMLERV